MKKIIYIVLLILPFIAEAQVYTEQFRKRGEVFKVDAASRNKKEDDSGIIVVTRETNRFVYEDEAIPDVYKKMAEKFMRSTLTDEKYKKSFVKYRLKVRRDVFGDIYIENQKVGNIKDVPTSK
nr:MAG TPA: hypothetical protein [Caudoviricetes sp.]